MLCRGVRRPDYKHHDLGDFCLPFDEHDDRGPVHHRERATFYASPYALKGAPMNLGPYAKTVTALVSGGIGWATLVVNSAPSAITAPEWIAGATYLAIALGVWTVPNAPG